MDRKFVLQPTHGTQEMKIMTGLLALVMAQSAFAVEKCEVGDKYCGLEPMAPAIVLYAILCSELRPENTKYYRAAVNRVFYGHRDVYREIMKDAKFQRTLRDARGAAATVSPADVDRGCKTPLSMGQEAIDENAPLENVADFGTARQPRKTIPKN